MSIGILTQEVIHQLRVVVYRKKGGFQVGLIHPSQRLEVLKDALFWTYEGAVVRLQQEVQDRSA